MEHAESPRPTEPDYGVGFEIDRDLIGTIDSERLFHVAQRRLGTDPGLVARGADGAAVHRFRPPRRRRAHARARRARSTAPDYEVVNFENRYRTKDGGWRWLRWSARSDGETWFCVAFDVTERRQAEARLRELLTNGNLLAYAQPIVDARAGSLVQEELLARVLSPDSSVIMLPQPFLPEAERHGLIGLVDRQMFDEGVELASQGRHAEINLSAQSICDEDFARRLEAMLADGASAERIVFEITETAAIEHLDAARDFADRMTRLGCRFALDDFGTGFGSLTYLRHLPVQFLKIDTTFVGNLSRSPDDQAMVRSIVAIAREFGLRTVAEGVEDGAALKLLRDYGVHNVQGYFTGRPVPLADSPTAL